jgi:hypothetical protein
VNSISVDNLKSLNDEDPESRNVPSYNFYCNGSISNGDSSHSCKRFKTGAFEGRSKNMGDVCETTDFEGKCKVREDFDVSVIDFRSIKNKSNEAISIYSRKLIEKFNNLNEKPKIWMYWETLPGKTKPGYINLCYESVLYNCLACVVQ